MPHSDRLPGIIIELKVAGRLFVSAKSDEVNDNLSRLNVLAVSAFDQIRGGQYDVEFRASGVGLISCFGVAFNGKNVELASGRLSR